MHSRGARAALAASICLAFPSAAVAAQAVDASPPAMRPRSGRDTLVKITDLDSLVHTALAVNPELRAGEARVDALRHRIGPATAWPDPMLMVGLENQPLGREPSTLSAHGTPVAGGPDPMTMRTVGVSQTIPYPGKTRLQRAIAQRGVDEAAATLEVTRQQIAHDVRAAYYQLAFVDRAMAIVDENQSVLATFIRTTEARYSVGQSGQQDVLKSRLEATRLAEQASSLLEERQAALARLNALLDRPSDAPLDRAEIPDRVRRAGIGDSAQAIRFTASTLGARAANSPLPSLVELQEEAIANNAELREHEAMIAAQTTRVDLTRKSALPDVDVSVQYGQRAGNLPDMLTAIVSVPIPVQKRRNQNEVTAEAVSTLAMLHAEHMAKVNMLRAEVARLVSELERERTQLALYQKGILPQGRAMLAAATSSYQVGKTDFTSVLESRATLFNYETEFVRTLSDFATNLAELERVVGKEVLR